MSANTFEEMRGHIGHNIVCVRYGQDDECVNVAIECETCGEVLFDLHEGESYYKDTGTDSITEEIWNELSCFKRSWALKEIGASDDACFECAKMEYNDLPAEWIELLQAN